MLGGFQPSLKPSDRSFHVLRLVEKSQSNERILNIWWILPTMDPVGRYPKSEYMIDMPAMLRGAGPGLWLSWELLLCPLLPFFRFHNSSRTTLTLY